MKNKNKYIGIWGILIFSLLLGCSQFEEINTNPDTSTQVSPSMLCTEISLRMFKSGGDAMSYISGNALPKYVGYAIMAQNDAQYNKIGSSDFGAMTILPNIDKMLEYAQGNVMEDSYKGVASFAKAYTFYNLTMAMGDVPYKEANMGLEGIYRPKYDTQEEIFKGILDELKAADQYFAKGIAFTGDPTPYNGDPVKWRKATNAFALKVLMTLSKKAEVASLGVKTRFAEIVTAGNLMGPTTGFLGLNYSTQNKHPLNSTNDMFTTKTVISSLLMNNLKNLNDYRLFYYSEPTGAKITAGKLPSDTAAYVGVDVSMDYSTMNADYNANKYSLLNKRYVTEDACEPRMILTYAEQQLIIAEARVIGWITTGTAQTYYEEGVKSALSAVMATKASYAHGKAIDQAYINGYFTGEAAFKSTTGDQLKQIWMQRYILNFMQIAESSFYEYRRNKYPEFPINPATSLNENNKNGIPMRWLYPSSETNYNRENLTEALDRQYEGYDDINKLMWLLK